MSTSWSTSLSDARTTILMIMNKLSYDLVHILLLNNVHLVDQPHMSEARTSTLMLLIRNSTIFRRQFNYISHMM